MRSTSRAPVAGSLAAALLGAVLLAGCGGGTDGTGSGASGSGSVAGSGSGSGSASGAGVGQIEGEGTLTLYNAQHLPLIRALLDGFTKETGITVRMRTGDDAALANLLVQEGSASPADVFVTENSPSMALVDSAGGLAKLDAATLAQVPQQYAPADGEWVGFAGRSTVLVHEKSLPTAELPMSILDLARPEWKGRLGFSPSGADFQAIVSAVAALEGEAAAESWLRGLKANAKVYQGNIAVMQAVNSGEIDAGIIYHYYWFRDQAESGQNSAKTALHYFRNRDPGAFVSVSGAGVVKSSMHLQEAQALVRYLTGRSGQTLLAQNDALEYSLAAGVPANDALEPLAKLEAPQVPLSDLNGPLVVELMQRVGLL